MMCGLGTRYCTHSISSTGLTQVVNFIGFLEYGYQLTKKYIAKMRNEGKVGVFLASVVWALVTYSYNSGILTAALTSVRH